MYCVFVFVFVLDQLLHGIMEYLYLIGVFHIFYQIQLCMLWFLLNSL